MDLETVRINYILGLGRSGTTLLLSELGKSKEVVANPESLFLLEFLYLFKSNDLLNHAQIDFFIETIFKLKTGRFVSLKLWKIDKQKLIKEAKSKANIKFIDLIKLVNLNAESGLKTNNPKVILDKNPPYTMHFDQLLKLDAKSKFIGIYRSYLDNIISRNKYRLDAVNHPYFHALVWCQYNEFLIRKATEYPDLLKLIRYEDLAQNPIENLKGARDFLGISHELKENDSMLPIFNLLNELSTSEEKVQFEEMHGKVFKAIDTESIGKKNTFFLDKQLNGIHYICTPISLKLGYPPVSFEKPRAMQRFTISIFKIILNFIELKHRVYFKSNHVIRKSFKYTIKPWLIFTNKS